MHAHTHTHMQTHKTTTVTLTHAHRGLIGKIRGVGTYWGHYGILHTLHNLFTTIPVDVLLHLPQEDDDRMEFWSIRVMNPSQLLLNGKVFPPAKLAPSALSITAFNS